MNGIIHTCTHPHDDDPHFRLTEEAMFNDIFHYIEVKISIVIGAHYLKWLLCRYCLGSLSHRRYSLWQSMEWHHEPRWTNKEEDVLGLCVCACACCVCVCMLCVLCYWTLVIMCLCSSQSIYTILVAEKVSVNASQIFAFLPFKQHTMVFFKNALKTHCTCSLILTLTVCSSPYQRCLPSGLLAFHSIM